MTNHRQETLLRELNLKIRDLDPPVPCEGNELLYDNVEGNGSVNRAAEYEAKLLCRSCPLKFQCLEYALVAKEPFGVWGGMTSEERKRVTSYAVKTTLEL